MADLWTSVLFKGNPLEVKMVYQMGMVVGVEVVVVDMGVVDTIEAKDQIEDVR